MTLTTLDIGFIPLADAAPLIVAQEIGFAREAGLELQFHRAKSWAMLRDMLVLEQVAAAHMLAPMPVAMALGLGPDVAHVEALMVPSVNGDSGRRRGPWRCSGPICTGCICAGRGRICPAHRQSWRAVCCTRLRSHPSVDK